MWGVFLCDAVSSGTLSPWYSMIFLCPCGWVERGGISVVDQRWNHTQNRLGQLGSPTFILYMVKLLTYYVVWLAFETKHPQPVITSQCLSLWLHIQTVIFRSFSADLFICHVCPLAMRQPSSWPHHPRTPRKMAGASHQRWWCQTEYQQVSNGRRQLWMYPL